METDFICIDSSLNGKAAAVAVIDSSIECLRRRLLDVLVPGSADLSGMVPTVK